MSVSDQNVDQLGVLLRRGLGCLWEEAWVHLRRGFGCFWMPMRRPASEASPAILFDIVAVCDYGMS